jgi:hypothetical protein
MSKRTFKPKTINFVDFYNEYANNLMKNNSLYESERNSKFTYIKHYRIFYYVRGKRVDIIDYETFRNIVKLYFKLAGEKIIAGKKLNLLNDLGYILIKCIEKDPLKQPVDWGESTKLKKQMIERGEELTELRPARDKKGNVIKTYDGQITYKRYQKWLVYFTDDEYILIDWIKPNFAKRRTMFGRRSIRWIPNLIFYEFKPSKGGSDRGFAKKASKATKENPNLLRNYEYFKK